MLKLLQTIESTIVSSQNVKSSYDLEYQSLTDAAYKYVGLFLSDADDDKLHDLADEICANAVKIGEFITLVPHEAVKWMTFYMYGVAKHWLASSSFPI